MTTDTQRVYGLWVATPISNYSSKVDMGSEVFFGSALSTRDPIQVHMLDRLIKYNARWFQNKKDGSCLSGYKIILLVTLTRKLSYWLEQ
jgi:hypothetical protein